MAGKKRGSVPAFPARLIVPAVHKAAVSVELLPDGTGVLLGGFQGVWIVDLPSGKERRRFRAYTGVTLWNARVSRDGKRIVGAFGDLKMQVSFPIQAQRVVGKGDPPPRQQCPVIVTGMHNEMPGFKARPNDI